MGKSFAEKFEEALAARRESEPGFGLRTLARSLADNDPVRTETIRRRLNKYRPRPGGGAAEVAPTAPTRREIERALGLDVDALAPEEDLIAALSPSRHAGDVLVNALTPFAEIALARAMERVS